MARHVGRPTKNSDINASAGLGIIVPGGLKNRLIAAAAISGRTLSSECEHRLDRSFLMDDVAAFLRAEINSDKE